MAADFNPYHVWLGIPPEEQPANHYRLLGLRLFETNPDVIDNAADRQMAHLRAIRVGKHGELSQQLLNEVAAARVCLLDPDKRAAYDRSLRAKPAVTTAASSPTANQVATGASATVQRLPRRTPTAAPIAAPPPQPPSSPPVAAVAPRPPDSWDDLLGDPDAGPALSPRGKRARLAAAKREATNRSISLAIACAVVLVALVGFIVHSVIGSSEGTLVFDWPSADWADATLEVDGTALDIPADGALKYRCEPGSHHIVGERLGYKLDREVTVAAGEELTVPPDWVAKPKAKAMLVLNWPLALRSGAELSVDGHVQPASRREPMEVAVEPGRHQIRITRPGFEPLVASVVVAAAGREVVKIAPPPAKANTLPTGDRIDLLADVDPARDTIAGKWKREDHTISTRSIGATLAFPTQIAGGNYELQVELSRTDGVDCVAVTFPVGETGCSFVLSNFQGTSSGLELIEGKRTGGDDNHTTRSPSELENGRRYVVRVVVKVEGENAEINCFLDDDQLVAWTGAVRSLGYFHSWRVPPHRIGVSEHKSQVTIYGARLLK